MSAAKQTVAVVTGANSGLGRATSVYAAIKQANPDPTVVAILQLETLARFADSDNAKVVVPFESAGLLGAAQALRSVLDSAAGGNGS